MSENQFGVRKRSTESCKRFQKFLENQLGIHERSTDLWRELTDEIQIKSARI